MYIYIHIYVCTHTHTHTHVPQLHIHSSINGRLGCFHVFGLPTFKNYWQTFKIGNFT